MQPEEKTKRAEKKQRRTSVVRLRLTLAERVALDAAATAARVGPCTHARIVIVTALGHVPTPPPRPRRKSTEAQRGLAKFLGEIGRLGNNLNQIARHANSGGGVERNAIEQARDELRRLREAIVVNRQDDGSPR